MEDDDKELFEIKIELIQTNLKIEYLQHIINEKTDMINILQKELLLGQDVQKKENRFKSWFSTKKNKTIWNFKSSRVHPLNLCPCIKLMIE